MSLPVTLQISLAPSDFTHAQHLLKHQVNTWQAQVKEVLLTIDFHRSPGRFSARWNEGESRIEPLAAAITGARVARVDYGKEARQRVSAEFFGGVPVPTKDFRGGPYYSYFFGLAEARHDLVLHVDSDMFFGGGSGTWLNEAIAYLEQHPNVLFVAPLPGPPHPGNRLIELPGRADPGQPHRFHFANMSTRLFLVSRARFADKIRALAPRRPPEIKNNIIALLEGNPCQELPENLLTAEMRTRGLTRVEFLGQGPGMWSLHPPYRGADFYRRLPDLVRRIENGDIPEEQRGRHDISDALVDWSEGRQALRRNRLWTRVWRRLRSH